MAVEAPISKYRKTNLKIYIAFCIGVAIYCAYDGYFSEKFKERHTNDGKPDTTLVLNRVAPPLFIGVAALFGVYLYAIRNKKLIADENELIFSDKERIHYDSIQEINKTHFQRDTKHKFESDSEGKLQETETDSGWRGYFIITYKNKDRREVNRKISDKKYDNLKPVLDELVAKIS